MCWFEAGLTDSFGPGLAPLKDGLKFLPGSFCPHYDSESLRRPRYEETVGSGALPDGYAADDGVGLLFEGRQLAEAVASLPGQHAYRLERRRGNAVGGDPDPRPTPALTDGGRPGRRRQELDLDEFMRLLPHLDAADLMAISASYQQADSGARDAARAAASAAARKRGLLDELGRLQGSIIQWASSDVSRSSAFTLEGLQTNPMLGDLRLEAVPPLLDAATALFLKDALPADHGGVLLEPLNAAIG